MDVKISGNFAQVEKILKELPTKLTTQPLISGINRTARDARNKGRKAIRATTGVKAKEARKRVRGATKKAAASRKRISASIFVRTLHDAPYSKAFTKTEIRRSESLNRSSFIATMESGKYSRWERYGPKRTPTKGSYAGRKVSRGPNKGSTIKRQAIRELRVPLHPIGTKAAERAIKNTVAAKLEKEVARALKLKLSKMTR